MCSGPEKIGSVGYIICKGANLIFFFTGGFSVPSAGLSSRFSSKCRLKCIEFQRASLLTPPKKLVGALWLLSLKLLKTSFIERGLDDQDFYCIAEASTWTLLNCTDEG